MILQNLKKQGSLKLWSVYKNLKRQEHKLTYLFWECTLNCNFFCKHCGSSAGQRNYPDFLTTAEIKKTLKEISEDFKPSEITIAVTGGEPLVRYDLFDVMGYARSLGFRWGMVTNGFLVTKEVVAKMKKTGMESVVVSIDGIRKVHDDFRLMKGAYKKAIEEVRLMKEAEFLEHLQITTSVHQGNVDSLEEMYKTFIPLGITSWRVMNVDPIGRAENNPEILLKPEQLIKLLDFIKEKRKTSPIEVTYDCAGYLGHKYEGEVRSWFFNCQTGINVASIIYNGDIFVCPNVPRRKEFIQGNVRLNRFSDIWNNKFSIFRNKDRTKNKDCGKCSSWEECLGGSFHLWDFDKNKPKLCHLKMLE